MQILIQIKMKKYFENCVSEKNKQEREEINMETLLCTAKRFYHDFYKNEAWDMKSARQLLEGKDYIDTRIYIIKMIYELILDNDNIDEQVKKWVITNKSLKELAELGNSNIARLRNQQNYTAKTLGEDLSIGEENLLHYIIYRQDISDETWEEIDGKIKMMRVKIVHKSDRSTLIQNKDILLNIPKKQFATELDNNAKWNHFIMKIKPYLVSERRKVQEEINTEFADAVAYFNYIITPGVNLTDIDKQRYNELKALLGEDNSTIQSVENASKDKDLSKLRIKEKQKELEVEKQIKQQEKLDYYEMFKLMSDEELISYRDNDLKPRIKSGNYEDAEYNAFNYEMSQRAANMQTQQKTTRYQF